MAKHRSRRSSSESRSLDEKMKGPEPRQRAKRDFQHARPVDAVERRIGVEASSRALREHDRGIAFAGQPERAAQHEPVLMAIELPDDLVIAARGIEIGDGRPEGARSASVVDRIE